MWEGISNFHSYLGIKRERTQRRAGVEGGNRTRRKRSVKPEKGCVCVVSSRGLTESKGTTAREPISGNDTHTSSPSQAPNLPSKGVCNSAGEESGAEAYLAHAREHARTHMHTHTYLLTR